MIFEARFHFGDEWSFPTVSLISSTNGRTIPCHPTLTEELSELWRDRDPSG